MSDRYPRVGDLVLVSCPIEHSEPRAGIVSKIELDKWGHQENVFIAWQGESAWGYLPDHGYAGLSMHNLRDQFRIFRDGQEIK